MTQFEEKSCKVLGVIVFLLIVMTWLQISGCSVPPPSDYIDEVEISNLA